jgi:DNA-directed RNA polymerase subunit alpha
MDSIFSPILSVGIKVENVRVGKMTNWDKLVLDIKTDGTITPEEAFDKTIGILIDQFKAVEKIRGGSEEKEEKISEDEKAEKEEKKKKAKKDE